MGKCMNCLVVVNAESNFCSNCGAHQLKNRLSTKEVLTELFEVILIWNKTFFNTSIQLLINPSIVITFYVKGGRNRYLNPLLYLLFCFFLFLLISSLLDKGLFFMSFMKGIVAGIIEADGARSFNTDSFPWLNRYSKIIYFLNLPILALLSSIFFRSSRLNFAEHLSINAYLMGEITLLGLVALPLTFLPKETIDPIVSVSMIITYITFCQYKIYQNKLLKSLFKSLGFMMLSVFLIIILYIFIAVIIASLFR
jgi:hypothetical protein